MKYNFVPLVILKKVLVRGQDLLKYQVNKTYYNKRLLLLSTTNLTVVFSL